MRQFLAKIVGRTPDKAEEKEVSGKQYRVVQDQLDSGPEQAAFTSRELAGTENLMENLRLYALGLERIRFKYGQEVVDTLYNTPSHLLSKKTAQESFCQKVGLTPLDFEQKMQEHYQQEGLDYVQLYEPEQEHTPVVEQLLLKIAAEIKLEQIKFELRDHNCLAERLKEGLASATRVGRSSEEIAGLQKELTELEGKNKALRNSLKAKFAFSLLNDLAQDINPAGERKENTEYASNWQEKLALYREELVKNRIYLDENFEGNTLQNEKALKLWQEIDQTIKERNSKRRDFAVTLEEAFRQNPEVGLAYYSGVVEEKNKEKAVANSVEDVTKDNEPRISVEEKWFKLRTQITAERQQKNLNNTEYGSR